MSATILKSVVTRNVESGKIVYRAEVVVEEPGVFTSTELFASSRTVGEIAHDAYYEQVRKGQKEGRDMRMREAVLELRYAEGMNDDIVVPVSTSRVFKRFSSSRRAFHWIEEQVSFVVGLQREWMKADMTGAERTHRIVDGHCG